MKFRQMLENVLPRLQHRDLVNSQQILTKLEDKPGRPSPRGSDERGAVRRIPASRNSREPEESVQTSDLYRKAFDKDLNSFTSSYNFKHVDNFRTPNLTVEGFEQIQGNEGIVEQDYDVPPDSKASSPDSRFRLKRFNRSQIKTNPWFQQQRSSPQTSPTNTPPSSPLSTSSYFSSSACSSGMASPETDRPRYSKVCSVQTDLDQGIGEGDCSNDDDVSEGYSSSICSISVSSEYARGTDTNKIPSLNQVPHNQNELSATRANRSPVHGSNQRILMLSQSVRRNLSSDELQCSNHKKLERNGNHILDLSDSDRRATNLSSSTRSPNPEMCETGCGARSVEQINQSLMEKIEKLHQQKELTDEVFKRAKEEEMIRRRQLNKFRSEVISAKKELLLSTLKNLKRMLDCQGRWLQTAYDSVLQMQWPKAHAFE